MILYQTTLTCPLCGMTEKVTMPAEGCRYYHECAYCKASIKAYGGDCCVFCSYSLTPCPPRQRERLFTLISNANVFGVKA